MDYPPERSDKGNSMVDDWVQTALSDALMRIVDNDWLDICEVDRVARALEQIRSARRLPSSVDKAQSKYAGLVALHCVNYREMERATLAGVPDALLSVFGLNDKSGPFFLGPKRWPAVRSRFQQQKLAYSTRSSVGPMPDRQRRVKPHSREARIYSLSRLATVRANAGSAVKAVGSWLRDALARTRAAWTQRPRIWLRPAEVGPSDLFLPARSSPSHTACHYSRNDVPASAPAPAAGAPCAYADPPDVGVQRAHAAGGARAVNPMRARERRRAPRGDQRVRRDSKSQNK
jgi:hypothetical protein